MVQVGDQAPDFTAPTESGKPLTLSSLRGARSVSTSSRRPTPTAVRLGNLRLRRQLVEVRSCRLRHCGGRRRPVSAQAEFATRCEVQFPLVADTNRAIARSYGVLGFLGFARRVTFFLGPDGTVQEIVSAIGPSPHVARALERAAGATPK